MLLLLVTVGWQVLLPSESCSKTGATPRSLAETGGGSGELQDDLAAEECYQADHMTTGQRLLLLARWPGRAIEFSSASKL